MPKPLPAKRSKAKPSKAPAPAKNGADGLGARLRRAREEAGLSLRELARRIAVSASLISQIERDKAMPSVGTLFAIAGELGLNVDALFKGKGAETTPARAQPILRKSARRVMHLGTGVRWESLAHDPGDEVEFLYVVYDVGGASCETDTLFRHGGQEYGYVLSGRLGIQIGRKRYELGPGDSLSFDAQTPHRLWTIGAKPAVAIFTILRRRGDPRRPVRAV